jgi:hypothetical protein
LNTSKNVNAAWAKAPDLNNADCKTPTLKAENPEQAAVALGAD